MIERAVNVPSFWTALLNVASSRGMQFKATTWTGIASFGFFLVAAPSYADVFGFDYSVAATGAFPTAVTASATLVADPTGWPDEFLVTSIGGTCNGQTVTGLAPVNGLFGSDNLIFSTEPHLDVNGISYTVAGAGDVAIQKLATLTLASLRPLR